MSNLPSAAPEPEAAQIGIPLDLAPLLTPYGHHQRLSVRVIQLPPLVCLSKGVANEDRSWSLAPGDLTGVELLLPEGMEPPLALAVRIVGIDRNENATIVGQFDVPLFSITTASKAAGGPLPAEAEPADWQRRTERRIAAALRLGERRAAQALAESEAQWELESEKRLSEQVKRLDRGWQRKIRSERTARGDAEAKAADAAQKLVELAEDLKSERAARSEAEARAAEAAEKLTGLAGELEAALARAAAAEVAEAARASDLQRSAKTAEARLAKELAQQAAAAEAKWQTESETRIAAAVIQAVQEAEAAAETRLEEARAAWQEQAAARLIEELAKQAAASAVKSDRESDAGTAAAVTQAVREAEAAAEARFEEARVAWQAQADREIEAIKLQSTPSETSMQAPDTGLAEAEAQWRAESEQRLSEQAERLEQQWQQKIRSESAARDEAEARAGEAAKQLSARSGELEAALARATTAEAAVTSGALELQRRAEEAEARLAEVLAKQGSGTQDQRQAASEASIAAAVTQAVRDAEAAAEARLQEASEAWQSEAQVALATAEAKWRADTAKRFAAARSEWQKEALAAINKDRRALRSVARRQRLAGAGRHILRLGLLAGGLAAVFFLATEFKPVIVKQWLPKATALISGIEAAARSQLESLWEAELPQTAVVAEIANLRAGPSTANEVLTTLPRGTAVAVLERRGDWIRIQAGSEQSQQGWLHRSLLEVAR